jgi:Uma2 family endonuclease
MALEKQLTTVDQFEAFLALPENADRRFELIDGEIVEKMPSYMHGRIAANLVIDIGIYLRQTKRGEIVVEARFKPPADDFNDRIPDISVVLAGRSPPSEGAVPFMPDLVVEVKSPTDSLRKMRDKARFYIAHGAQLVWLFLPERAYIEIYSPDDEWTLHQGDTLTGGDVLPGFELPVSSIFANVQ